MRPELQEGEDYVREEDGRIVFTEEYHLKRGWCCGCRCRRCPWRRDKAEESRPPDAVQ